MQHKQTITFQGMADMGPDIIPGDVIFELSQKKHDVFSVDGMDLHMTAEITLLEALTEFCFPIVHLDGRKLMCSNSASPIHPGDSRVIQNEGMPQHKNPFEKGSLVIHFSVKFPEFPLSNAQQSVCIF